MLLGKDNNATCIWRGCDPYTTKAVTGVEGDGHLSNCGRVNKDGINYVKAEQEGFERYISLYYTPYEFGGCNGCRFFLMCKGNCPGTSIDNDWRNRTEHCQIWKTVYEYLETDFVIKGIIPISVNKKLRDYLENEFLKYWRSGKNVTMQNIIAKKIKK
jgi:uncharacterized protein